jgi:hypothetical protein
VPAEGDRTLLATPRTAEDVPDARLRALYGYWIAKCAGRPMPLRRDIDVLELAPWLGNLMLIEVLEGGAEFRYRVYGSTLAQYYGRDLTGKTTEGVPEEARKAVRREYRAVLADGRPVVILRDREVRHRTMRVAKLVLPLSSDGAALDLLLVGSFPLA